MEELFYNIGYEFYGMIVDWWFWILFIALNLVIYYKKKL